jgi:exonuclease VII small subunit
MRDNQRMSEAADRLDEVIDALERAAAQLRSGELSVDAAATLVEDCAALAGEASQELEQRARRGAEEHAPAQEPLL